MIILLRGVFWHGAFNWLAMALITLTWVINVTDVRTGGAGIKCIHCRRLVSMDKESAFSGHR